MPEREGVVPAWQELPPEAKVALEDLRHTGMHILPVAVLSYGWAATGPPAPARLLQQRRAGG